MTPNQFWYDEPRLLDAYIKKKELDLDVINYNSWLIGLYTEKALSVVLSHAFSENSTEEYFNSPLDCFNYEKQEKQEAKQKMTYREQKNAWSKFGKKGGK